MNILSLELFLRFPGFHEWILGDTSLCFSIFSCAATHPFRICPTSIREIRKSFKKLQSQNFHPLKASSFTISNGSRTNPILKGWVAAPVFHPKGPPEITFSLQIKLKRPDARSSHFYGRKPLLTTKKQQGQRRPRPVTN